jgi:hypothetical protein
MAPRRLARVGLFAAALLVAGCGAGASAQIDASGSWQRLPDPPLSPREFAVGVWTGRRALIFGGSDAPPTHPSSSGPEMRKPPLRDGAAFDPRTGSWRRIAVAPSGIEPLSPVASAGDSVYVAVPRNPGSRDTRMDVLAYRTRTDSWDRLPSSPRRNFAIVAIGDRLVASGPGRGPRPLSVFLLGRGERRWKELPRPPVRGAVTWNGRRLVVIGFDPAARDYRNPPLARAATLKLGDDAWRRLPDADHVLWVTASG